MRDRVAVIRNMLDAGAVMAAASELETLIEQCPRNKEVVRLRKRVMSAVKALTCGVMLMYSAGTMAADCRVCTVYGIGSDSQCVDQSVRATVKPVASDGKYSGYVRLTWPKVANAYRYKIRRATSANYSKSKVIATVYAPTRSYKDVHPADRPNKRYYYWIVPYDVCGNAKKNVYYYDSGHAKQKLSISVLDGLGDNYFCAGEIAWLSVTGNANQHISAADCKWSIVSGSQYATVSSDGMLMCEKNGMVVVKAQYNGASATLKCTISSCAPLYGVFVR